MVEKANLSPNNMSKIKSLLEQENAVQFMSSEESDQAEEGATLSGPPPRHIKTLRWERTKLKNITATLDATYQARMSKRQKRTASKVLRVADRNLSDRPMPTNCPPWAGRVAQN